MSSKVEINFYLRSGDLGLRAKNLPKMNKQKPPSPHHNGKVAYVMISSVMALVAQKAHNISGFSSLLHITSIFS